jgi:hypothetical protein
MRKSLFKIVLALAMQASISSCFEFDLGWGDWGASHSSAYDSIFYAPTNQTYDSAFFIDSVSQVGKSMATIWAHILYDTVLVINARTAYTGYLNQPEGEGYSIIQSQPDTIDFRQLADTTSVRNGRKEWIYNYTVDVDSLTSGTSYWFCIITDYHKYLTGRPIWQSDYVCIYDLELK